MIYENINTTKRRALKTQKDEAQLKETNALPLSKLPGYVAGFHDPYGQRAGRVGQPPDEVEQRGVGVVGPVRVQLGEEGAHADEAGDGEDADRHGGLVADVDLA